ncbi:NAD(P)-binding protein [Thozetella sp. PMI_491]|nr:NAD(P)-binding protein [Thozetella sp. PMI_491]
MAADTLSLDGKVAIVTGSGRENGIGAAIALAMARNGARIAVNYVSDSSTPRAAEVVKKIQAVGGEAISVQVDLSDRKGAKKLVEETLKGFGVEKIDILVNNAAHARGADLLTADEDAVETTFRVGVFGPFYLIQAVVPVMPRGGRIINVGSVASKVGAWWAPFYSASKAAMDALSFTFSRELGRNHGITINTVMPGPVPTDSLPRGPVADYINGVLIPMTRGEEREGTVDDIADAVLLLASEKSRWITGQTISVSGGITGN